MDADAFKVGDSVTWMHCVSSGTKLGFSTREGQIINLQGPVAFVKMRNKRVCNVLRSDLTKKGERTALTKLFDELRAERDAALAEVKVWKGTAARCCKDLQILSSIIIKGEDNPPFSRVEATLRADLHELAQQRRGISMKGGE